MSGNERMTPQMASTAPVRVDIPLNGGRPLSGDGGLLHVDFYPETVTLSVGSAQLGTVGRDTFRAWWQHQDTPLTVGAVRWSRHGAVTSVRIDYGITYTVPASTAAHLGSVT